MNTCLEMDFHYCVKATERKVEHSGKRWSIYTFTNIAGESVSITVFGGRDGNSWIPIVAEESL